MAASSALSLSLGTSKLFGEERELKVPPKKGIGIAAKTATNWAEQVKKLNVGWHYSWGLKVPENEPKGVYFVPMTWGKWGLDKAVEYLKEVKNTGIANDMLGFNEPDGKDQSNISVEKALELWSKLQESGLRLGSPSCVHADNDWMKEFMAGIKERKLRVDFVTFHDYGGGSTQALINKLKVVYELYGKPIWITEFAVGDWKAKTVQENVHSPAKVLRFMKEVLPELDKIDWVERYAWFPAGRDNAHLGTSALFNPDFSLTTLGKYYSLYGTR